MRASVFSLTASFNSSNTFISADTDEADEDEDDAEDDEELDDDDTSDGAGDGDLSLAIGEDEHPGGRISLKMFSSSSGCGIGWSAGWTGVGWSTGLVDIGGSTGWVGISGCSLSDLPSVGGG